METLERLCFSNNAVDSSTSTTSDTSTTLPLYGLSRVGIESSLSIGAGSMGFVGDFIQAEAPAQSQPQAPTSPSAPAVIPAGNINASFNGDNKAYGALKGKGEMNVSLSGDSLFSSNEAKTLGYTWAKPVEIIRMLKSSSMEVTPQSSHSTLLQSKRHCNKCF